MRLLILLLLSASSLANASETKCGEVDWIKIRETWSRYDKAPDGKLEKELLGTLPVNIDETEGCPSFDDAYKTISKNLKGLQSRVASGIKSALCVTFRLQALSNGAFSLELEKLSNEGLRKQKGLDELAFKNACQTQRKAVNAANHEEKFVKEKMTPTEKACESELERFVEMRKKWVKDASEASNKNRCLLVLKKVKASSERNALCDGITELVTATRAKIEAKCGKMED